MPPQLALSLKEEPFLVWCAQNLVGEVTYVSRSLIVGRDPENCDVLFNNDLTSRQHANIVVDPEGNALLIDLNSSNGTFVNGQPVQRVLLKDGDKIGLGSREVVHCVYHAGARQPQIEKLHAVDITEVPTTALKGKGNRCPNCSRIMTGGLTVCRYCSAAPERGTAEAGPPPAKGHTEAKCGNCGAAVAGEESNYCRRCGTRLTR